MQLFSCRTVFLWTASALPGRITLVQLPLVWHESSVHVQSPPCFGGWPSAFGLVVCSVCGTAVLFLYNLCLKYTINYVSLPTSLAILCRACWHRPLCACNLAECSGPLAHVCMFCSVMCPSPCLLYSRMPRGREVGILCTTCTWPLFAHPLASCDSPTTVHMTFLSPLQCGEHERTV